MKICTKCNVPKEETEFNKHLKREGQPLRSQCKQCQAAYRKNATPREGINYDPYGTKVCGKCKEEKPVSQFFLRREKGREGTLFSTCKQCHRTYCIAGGYEGTPDINKRNITNNRKRMYGITQEDYDRMQEDQRGLCAICKQPSSTLSKWGTLKSLSVDHCHATGKVRGLLCDACNRGLGYFKDDTALIQSAIEYLSKV